MNKRILVIDDDEAIRKLFVRALEDTEYQVDTVGSGEKAVEASQRAKYDLIYLDLRMPGMDGIETLRQLRKIDQDVPVYIVTAFYEEFLDRLKDVKKDSIDFELLHKPIGSAQLVAITRGILEGPEEY